MDQPTSCPAWCNPHLHITTHRHLLDTLSDASMYLEILVREHSGKRGIRLAFGETDTTSVDLTAMQASLIAANPERFTRALAAGVELLGRSS